MIANGFDVAVMEHHVSTSGGGFTNQYSQARISYYGISGIPRSYFDGITYVSGGSTSTYTQFVAKYNQRIAVPSNFTVAINGFNEGNDYTVLLSLENVEPYAGTNLVAHLAITESNLSYQGDVYNYVTRYFVPNANGTPVDFSVDPVQLVMLEFSMSPSWIINNCEFVAFIQDNSTKEILQATKVVVPDLAPMYYDNASSEVLYNVPILNCTEDIAPQIVIMNEGADPLTSVDINYKVNDEAVNTYNWTGNLNYGEMTQVELPAVGFELLSENNLMVYTSNPNGNPDEDPSNDTLSTNFASASEVIPSIHLYLKLDNNPEETTWQLKNSAGEVLYSAGPYSEPLQYIHEVFDLTEDDCYTFMIYDAGENGLSDPGFFTLRQDDFAVIFDNQDFGNSEELVQFSINMTGSPEIYNLSTFSVYPNPFKDFTYVSLVLDESVDVEINIYNVIGEIIYTSSYENMGMGNHTINIDTKGFDPGVYFVNLRAGDKVYAKKISSR